MTTVEAATFKHDYQNLCDLWTEDMIATGCVLVFSLYVLLALIFHQVKVEKKRSKKFLCLSPAKKTAVLSKYICIIVAVISFINHLISFLILWVELTYSLQIQQNSNNSTNATTAEASPDFLATFCQVLPKLESTFSELGAGFVFLFLWFRQRIFFFHPSLQVLNNRASRFINFILFMVWTFYTIPSLVSFYVFVNYDFKSPSTCCLLEDQSVSIFLSLVYSWIGVSVFMQIVLLSLFIYPIVKKNAWVGQNNAGKTLIQRAKKAVLLTSICLMSDMFSGIFAIIFDVRKADTGFFVFNLNLLVNQIVVIFCFDHWKLLIWPWNAKRKINDSKQTQNNPRKNETGFLSVFATNFIAEATYTTGKQ